MTTADVTRILERLARIEEKLDARTKLDALTNYDARIASLEAHRNRAVGAMGALGVLNVVLGIFLAVTKL